jgi:malonyl-CoA O-methyltransferase
MKPFSLKASLRPSTRRVTELEPFEAYQLWAETYDDVENNGLLFAEQSVILPILEQLPISGGSVLDAGCGTGRYMRVIQKLKPRLLAGIDFSPNMIRKAKSVVTGDTHLHVSRLDQLPFNQQTFDVVISTLAIDHVEDLDRTFLELSRVMCRPGTMIISCFHPHGLSLGWQRTFRPGNGPRELTMAVKYYGHQHDDYVRAAKQAGLTIHRTIEPVIDENLAPFYRRSRRHDLYERYRGYPILLIMELRKT